MKHLKDLPKLQELNIGQTKITDGGLDYLKGMKSLKEVYLSNDNVTDAAVNRLRMAMPKAKVYR